MPLLIAVLLGLSGLIVVIYPLLGLDRQSPDALTGLPLADMAEREWTARDALREVEFDHRLGNLDDADYAALRSRYERRALSALKVRYQREQEIDALIERQLDDLRRQQATTVMEEVGETHAVSDQAATTADASNGKNTYRRNGARLANGPQARRRKGGRA